MGLVGIKVKETTFNANIVKIMRRYSDESISDIKKKVINREYLYVCDYIDFDGLATIVEIYNAMKKTNIDVELFEHEEITTIEFLNNLIQSYSETEKQVEEEIGNEIFKITIVD